jgi:hypothetical protein
MPDINFKSYVFRKQSKTHSFRQLVNNLILLLNQFLKTPLHSMLYKVHLF